MSHKLITFNNVPLPEYDPDQQLDPTPVEPTLRDSVGGVFDFYGSQPRSGRKQQLTVKGVYFGETEYWADDSGDLIDDESDNLLIWGDGPNRLRAQVDALREKIGTRGQLVRRRSDDDVEEWRTARLLQVQHRMIADDQRLLATVSAMFELIDTTWHAETVTETSSSASSGAPLGLTVDNGGAATVYDATLTVANSSGTITAISVSGTGIDLAWTGSLGSGETLTIDCGAQTVREGSSDSFSGFSLGGSHTARGWLPLQPGANLLMVTVTGGGATVTVSHYNQQY